MYEVGEYIIFEESGLYKLGRIKSLDEYGALVCYNEDETAEMTPYVCMYEIDNKHTIKTTTLGGNTFNGKN